MSKIPLTREGEKKLRDELDQLKSQRPKIIQTIAEAREHGDLKENAEYHAAREQQGLIEAKIKQIESKLSNFEIIEQSDNIKKEQVIFGCQVELLNIDNNTRIIYTIVGEDDSDSLKNKISYNSPIGKGLIGKKINDNVTISVPKGDLNFKILKII
jgi:transcription elongation factor GreA